MRAGKRQEAVLRAEASAAAEPGVVFRTKESQVAEFLRERILSGHFVRGQKLKQAELAKMFNLSITPVREALKLLEAEGYVLGSSHRGAVVAPFDLGQVGELYDLRLELETRLVREATKRASPEGIKALLRINQEMLESLRRSDLPALRSGNVRFHFRLYEWAEMPQTMHFVRILWAKYPFDMLAVMPNRQHDVVREHKALLDAVSAGDVKAAVRELQAHLASGHRKFQKHYLARKPAE
jgi:DNA-binding GntR family transcriptional regulator